MFVGRFSALLAKNVNFGAKEKKHYYESYFYVRYF